MTHRHTHLRPLPTGDALDPYLPLHELATYSGLSIRSLRRAVADRLHPLPHYRPRGKKIVVRRSEFDRWIQSFKHTQAPIDLNQLVDNALKGLGS